MEHQRIKSTVEDPAWGRGIVFVCDPESKVQLKTSASVEASRLKLQKTLSRLWDENDDDNDQPEDAETELGRNHLPYLQSALYATILEDSIAETRLLSQCNTELKISQTNTNVDLLLALKFGVEQPPYQDALDGWDLQNLSSDSNKIKKLDEDRMRRDTYKQLRQQRNHIKSAIYDCDCTIDELKKQVEDSSLYDAVRSRYVENWQQARTEQNTQSIHDNEIVNSVTIEYYKMRNDHEHRVHSEVELLGNIIINETIEKVDSWMNKYDHDMEHIDLKIQVKKNCYQNMRDKRIDYENLIEKHDQLMKDWIHFKEEREKARRYRELMTKSAIIVQAWWRGLLVRRQLGPYKVAKKKGGKKK